MSERISGLRPAFGTEGTAEEEKLEKSEDRNNNIVLSSSRRRNYRAMVSFWVPKFGIQSLRTLRYLHVPGLVRTGTRVGSTGSSVLPPVL